jgi:hypothetical protein
VTIAVPPRVASRESSGVAGWPGGRRERPGIRPGVRDTGQSSSRDRKVAAAPTLLWPTA